MCDITVSGPIDDKTGFVVDLGVLDRILKEQVMDRFDHRNINLDVAEFADGKLVPTGENLARYIFERVEKELPKPAKVMRVTVGKTTASALPTAGSNTQSCRICSHAGSRVRSQPQSRHSLSPLA